MAKEIAQLPIAPDSGAPATFNERADAFVKALQPFADDANALAKELEEFSKNVDTKSGDVDTKYANLVQKYNDFTTKYDDFFAKYDIFTPKYDDAVKKHGEVVLTAKAHKEYVDTLKAQIDEALERAKSFINEQNKVIDDSKVAETSTYSSKKINEELGKKVGIDDDTVTIKNLKISKQKISNLTKTSEILFRTAAGNSFEISDVKGLYGGLKEYIDFDFLSAPLVVVNKGEEFDFDAGGVSFGNETDTIKTDDGSYVVYSTGRQAYRKLLRISAGGALSTLSLPSQSTYTPITVFEGEARQLYIVEIGGSFTKIYKLDKSGGGSWRQIPNPQGVEIRCPQGTNEYLVGTKKSDDNYKYSSYYYDAAAGTWKSGLTNERIPDSTSYEHIDNCYFFHNGFRLFKESRKRLEFFPWGSALLNDGIFEPQNAREYPDVKRFYEPRKREKAFFENEKFIIFYDSYSRKNILKRQDGETFALENDVPLERAGYWVKIGGEYAYFSSQSGSKARKYTLNKKMLRYYEVEK